MWNQVCKTPPKHTKQANNGRFKFTCIDPQWQTKQATELWGPYGAEWGLTNIQFTPLDDEAGKTLLLTADFYYPIFDGSPAPDHARFEIAVDLPFRRGRDVAKCLITAAKSKALSFLGFGADVFMGMYDDVSYVQQQEIASKDSEVVRRTMLARVKSAESVEVLEEQTAKLTQMIADDIVSGSIGHEVYSAIDARRKELEASK